MLKLDIWKLSLLLVLVFVSCNNDNDEEEHDPIAQEEIDDELITTYLQHHYFNETTELLDTILNGETSLWDDDRMFIDMVNSGDDNDIDYNLYYFVINEGKNESPSTVDSVFTKYTGSLMSTGSTFDANDNFWTTLDAVIRGWSYGFTHFKTGDNVSQENEPLRFENTGQGYLFIPSGLGYGNNGINGIPENSNLIFQIELKALKYRDNDLDGTLSKDEDANGNRDLTDDDADGDGIPDYLDPDTV